jgi:hypothetical protein
LDSFPDLSVGAAALIAIINPMLCGGSVPQRQSNDFGRIERTPRIEPNPFRDDVPHYEVGGGYDADPLSGLNGLGDLFGHL